MKLIIDISKDRYDEIMAMDWKNCRPIFDEEIRAIHDGKALKQEPKTDVLNKIRAEIDEQYDRVHPYDISCAEGLEMALGIIDKYMAEGGEKE